MKNKKSINSDEINAKKEELKKRIEESKEKAKVRSSPAKEFLEQVKDVVKDGLDNGVSYTQLSKDIYAVYNFKVSEQTIRAFAHSVLGVPKRPKKSASPATTWVKNEVLKTSSQIKEESAKKTKNDKELSL